MAAVASLNNSSSSSSTTTMTPAGGPPSPGSLEAAAAGLPKWLLAAATLRLQETTAAAAATGRKSPPAQRHHQQQQNQPIDQPLDLSAKSNSNNNNNNVSGSGGSSSASSTPSCPSSSSTPSAELKNVPATVAINPFTSDLIASEMVNQLRDLLPNTSTFLPHPATLNVPMVNTNNRNMFKSRPGKQPSHLAGRKTYTEDELQKALRDIQCGKLGTRRAAVIYGIPRSTLRNKVYKLALERDSTGSGGTGVSAGVAIRDASTVGDNPSNGQAAELLPMLANDDDNEDECNTNRATADDKDHHHHQQHHHHNSGHQLHLPPQHRGQQPRTPSSSYMTVEDLLRITVEQQQQAAGTMLNAETLRMFLQHYTNNKLLQNRLEAHYRGSGRDVPVDGRSPSPPPTAATRFPLPIIADLWPAVAAAAALDPQHMGTYLSHLLSSSVTSPAAGLESPHLQSSGSSAPPPSLPPQQHVSAAHHHQQEFLKDFTVKDLMRKILDEEQQQQLQQLQLQYGNKMVDARRWTSNGCSSSEPMDTGRSNDDDSNPSNVILRIPSYKPVPGSKGGDYESAVSGRDVSSPGRANSARSDSSSPPSSSGGGKHPVNLKDVIAKNIKHRFQSDPTLPPPIPAVESFARAYQQYQQQHHHQQQQQQQQHHHHLHQQQPIGMSASFDSGNSVLRNHNNNNLQQEDCRKRVFTPTNKSSSSVITPSSASAGFHTSGSSSSSSNSASAAAAAAAAAAAGDKSTRPKRGKYRNYDRDSLVEAVRAVQRGEMSVHRAGSYYGVPHSTLEYKVKERHLMRPKKREPKNPPSSSSVSAAVADHHSDRKKSSSDLSSSSSSAVRPAIKLSAHVQFPSAAQQQPSSLPTLNGLKMFDAADGPVSPYQPSFPFWAPSPFHVPMEFQRNPVTFLPMSMMQRMQAESRLHHHQAAAVTAASIASLGKNAREVAENLYDETDNGSFLDGIIRSSLETGLKSAATMAAVQTAAKNAIKGGGAGRDGVGSGGEDCSPEGSPRAAGPEDDGEDRPASPPPYQDSAADS